MKGDFSRDSFDPGRHFTRVLLQQGRVLTDADFNEQAAIQQHFLRTFVVDLVGWRWRVGEGFAIGGGTAEDFTIGAGRFYLGGMACENADACRYRTQPADAEPRIMSQALRPNSPDRGARANVVLGKMPWIAREWPEGEGPARFTEMTGSPDNWRSLWRCCRPNRLWRWH
jgi:hypothetical protein